MPAAELEIAEEKLAVVGLGVVSPLGNNANEFWRRLINEEHGIKICKFPIYPNSKVKVAGLVEGFEEQDWERLFIDGNIVDPSDFDFYHVSTWAAIEVARQALAPFTHFKEQNGRLAPVIDPEIFDSNRIGLVVATEGGGTVEEAIKTHERIKAGKRSETESVIRGLNDTSLGAIMRAFGLHGRSFLTGSACASGEDAIAIARELLLSKQREVDAVLVVGTEFSNHHVPRAQFEETTALSTRDDPDKTPSPFDQGADGFVIANGAGGLLLTREGIAREKRLNVRAYHLGSGAYDEAYSMTSPLPNGEGTYRALLNLLNKTVGGKTIKSMLQQGQYFTKMHGTGTNGDGPEAMGLKMAVEEIKNTFVGLGSLKGALGHSLSAAALVEDVAAVLMLENETMAPNIKCPNPIAAVLGMPLNRVATARQLEFVMTLANGFGGHQRSGVFQSARSTIV